MSSASSSGPRLLLLALALALGCNRSGPDGGADDGTSGDGGTQAVDANLPVEPLPRHPRIELSNLRFGMDLGGAESFQVDWMLADGPEHNFMTLVVRPSEGSPMEMSVNPWIGETAGTISGAVTTFGFSDAGPSLESGCEMYLVIRDGSTTYKISNSVTSGGVSTTGTRQATPAEIAQRTAPAQPASDPAPDPARNPAPPVGQNRPVGAPVAGGGRPAAPEQANLKPVPADIDLPPGTPLKAEWAGRWLPVTVVETAPGAMVKIHWENYSAASDELKPRAMLRVEESELTRLRLNNANPGNASNPTPTAPPTQQSAAGDGEPQPVTASTVLTPGQKVEMRRGAEWVPATVQEVRPDGRLVVVRPEGPGGGFDRPVPRAFLRLPAR